MNDLADLHRAFARLHPMPETEVARLLAGSRVTELAKGELLVRQDEPAEWLGFLARGLVRIYCNRDGREVNLGFELEGGFVGDYAAYMQRGLANQSQQALEPSRVVRFPRELLDRLLATDARWRELSGRVAEVELVRKLQQELETRAGTADDRYDTLVAQRSPLLQRVPLYHLASYLGVTPETLSRIRSRRARGDRS